MSYIKNRLPSSILLFLILMMGWSCRESPSATKKKMEQSFYEGKVNVKKWQDEILDVDSLKIDGDISFMSNKNILFNHFGKPDRVNEIGRNIGYLSYIANDSAMVANEIFYGRTIFESIGDIVVPRIIDFESTNVNIIHPKINLRKGLDVGEVCKIYPESCKLILMGGNLWSGHIELRASNSGLDPRRVFLIFRNEKLVKVAIHTFSRR